jgi:hypothetical protein
MAGKQQSGRRFVAPCLDQLKDAAFVMALGLYLGAVAIAGTLALKQLALDLAALGEMMVPFAVDIGSPVANYAAGRVAELKGAVGHLMANPVKGILVVGTPYFGFKFVQELASE